MPKICGYRCGYRWGTFDLGHDNADSKIKRQQPKSTYRNIRSLSRFGNLGLVLSFAKENKLPVADAYAIANELKVIIYNKHDFIFAEEQAEKVNPNAILFLQPEWSKKEEMTPLIVDYVMNHPKWRVSLQTHKYLNIP